jgi:DNA-directed RNA polymerase subunit RPC12/RpoP
MELRRESGTRKIVVAGWEAPPSRHGGQPTAKYSCLACRETRKRVVTSTREAPDKLTCPTCGSEAYWMSHKFRSPRKTDVRAWAVVDRLVRNGFRYIPVEESYPTEISEVDAFLARNA